MDPMLFVRWQEDHLAYKKSSGSIKFNDGKQNMK